MSPLPKLVQERLLVLTERLMRNSYLPPLRAHRL